MNHRERVLAAISFDEPDRVPIDLGSTSSLIVDPVYFQLKDLLGIKGDIKPFRSGSTANYYDERILEKLDIDFRHIWYDSPNKPKPILHPDNTVTDGWGIIWSMHGSYPVYFPLKNASYADLKDYQFPFPDKNWDLTEVKNRAKNLFENTDYAIVAKAVYDGGGILERAYYLRGIEELFTDMYLNKRFVWEIFQKIAEVEIAYWDAFLNEVGPYVHIIQRVSDLGTQNGLFISPKLYRKFLKPFENMVIDFIREKAPKAKIWFHSCGAISELIEDFIGIGIEILNPVQPLAEGMDSFELKKRFGKYICFHGGIDLQVALKGSVEDVKKEVEKRISAFGHNGGYILAPANHIQEDTSAENVNFLYKHAVEYGKYPLKDVKGD